MPYLKNAPNPEQTPDQQLFRVFQSTYLHHAQYSPADSSLSITFNSGQTIVYDMVPVMTWAQLLSSPSPGRYFHLAIKDQYPRRNPKRK